MRTITEARRGRRAVPSDGGSSVPVPLIPAGTSGTPAVMARRPRPGGNPRSARPGIGFPPGRRSRRARPQAAGQQLPGRRCRLPIAAPGTPRTVRGRFPAALRRGTSSPPPRRRLAAAALAALRSARPCRRANGGWPRSRTGQPGAWLRRVPAGHRSGRGRCATAPAAPWPLRRPRTRARSQDHRQGQCHEQRVDTVQQPAEPG